jgi:hypothetical protein
VHRWKSAPYPDRACGRESRPDACPSQGRATLSADGRRRAARGGLAGLVGAVATTLALGFTGPSIALADDPTRSPEARTSGAETYWVLKRGVRGPTVRRLQRRLGLRADGVFGKATARAVRRFQRRRGLTPDGIVGPMTARALGIKLPPRRSGGGGGGGGLGNATPSERRTLRRIAQCESGGNPRAVSRNGLYRGKYQFHRDTWRSVGGSGDPADASEREQDRRALILLRRSGTAPWAACA